MKQEIIVVNGHEDLPSKKKAIADTIARKSLIGRFAVYVGDVKRNLLQNSKLWPMLTDISLQIPFAEKLRSKEDWKTITMSGWLAVEKGITPNVLTGLEWEKVVLTDFRSSELGKRDFASFIEYVYAIGDYYKVKWSEKACKAYETYKEANE